MRTPRRSRLVSRSVALLTALLTLSCEQVVVSTVRVHRVDISPPAVFLTINETTPLTVTVLSRDGRTLSGRTIEWSSQNPDIATVDESGTVRGLVPGSATIQATSEGALGTANVTVTSGPAIAAAPREVEFAAVQNGATPGDRAVNITNAGDGALTGLTATIAYAPGEPTGWLTANLTATTAPTTLTLTPRVGSLDVGTYNARVRLAASGASNTPVDIPVSFTIAAAPPAPPGAPAATAVSDRHIDVSWTDQSDNEARFDIERSADGSTGWTVIGSADANRQNHADSAGLAGSSTYYYRVSACNTIGCSPNATVAAATTAPNAPMNLEATATTSSQVYLTWNDNSTDETAFPIERSSNGGQSWSAIGTAAAGARTYSDADAAPGTTYRYRVRACRNELCSRYSNETSATTPPNAPTQLSATAASHTRVELSWTAPPEPVTGYSIERRVGNGAFNALANTTGNATSYADNTVQETTSYTYRVKACDEALCSAFSNQAAVTTPAAPLTPPGAPSGLTATVSAADRIDLAWHAASGTVSRYRIERKNDTLLGAYAIVDSVPGGTLAYQSTGLTPAMSYSHRVQACNSAGCSGYSNEVTTSTPVVTVSGPASLVAAAVSATQINLTWNHDGLLPLGEFEIERALNATGSFTLIETVSGTARSYPDTGLTGSTTYYYRVRTCTPTDCSAWSSVANSRTLSPATPTGVAAVATSASQIRVSWTAPGGQTSYVIRRRMDGKGQPTTITVSDPNATSYSDTGLSARTRYTYEVRACGAENPCSSFSGLVSATTF